MERHKCIQKECRFTDVGKSFKLEGLSGPQKRRRNRYTWYGQREVGTA